MTGRHPMCRLANKQPIPGPPGAREGLPRRMSRTPKRRGMTVEELRRLLEAGEGQRLEYKQEAIKPSDLAETLIAFANSTGGTVLIGVDDEGRPVGIAD